MEVNTSDLNSIEASTHVHGGKLEVDLLSWKLLEASMGVYGTFTDGGRMEACIASSIAASTTIFGRSFRGLPYTPIYSHLLPRVSQTSSCSHKHSTRVHQIPFDLLSWNFPPTSMEFPPNTMEFSNFPPISMKVNKVNWK